jgi:choline monooxygenase
MGVIFINLSGDAPEFQNFIEPIESRWQAFTGKNGLQAARTAPTGSTLELEVQANWKLPVENYCEAYHLPWVHPALNSYSPLDVHYNLIVNDSASGQGTLNYNLADVAGISLPQFPNWASR